MDKKNSRTEKNGTTKLEQAQHTTINAIPIVTGQRAEVLSILRRGPTLSLCLTADHAIPEAAARIHELREQGFNIETVIQGLVPFRGRERRNVALYVLKNPEWPHPDFNSDDFPPVA
ncbi:helix-turn-helix domain-containing protein [Aeromonas sp. S11(2024)]|uniref:helix-turn-helix domain-containing protein n=1 Tax=Aeromonas TaxID=642 RepID=UPI000B59B308|nr:helix-turn-helix domain-containing protein [Aeromonas veronii]